MNIADKTVVQFHYSLKNSKAEELESSNSEAPLSYLYGAGNILPGLEAAMKDKSTGDKFSVNLAAKQAYGERQENAQQRIPIKHLSGAKKWRPGMTAQVQTEHGVREVQVVKVGKFMVDIDTNHPLAGQDLSFDIEIVSVRSATAEEISHGHVHGEGGHHH